MRRGSQNRGFTLIEVVVSVTLVAIGIVSAMRAISTLTESDIMLRSRERMQRLAIQKYDELIATGVLTNASQNGDFTDWNNSQYVWKAEVVPSGVTDLDEIKVTVTENNNPNGPSVEVDGLRYDPPATTTTGGTGG